MSDTHAASATGDLLEHRQRAGPKQVIRSLVRIFGAIGALLLVYFMFPLEERENFAIGLAAVLVGLLIYGYIFIRQLKRIRRADYPLLRAAEAIALVATLFIILMSTCATAFAASDPSSYSEDLSRLDALYFTVTTLATVGFGDITPTSEVTRAFTIVQILLGVGLLGVGLRSLVGVAQRVTADRQQGGAGH